MPQLWNEWNETSYDLPVPKRLARRTCAVRGNARPTSSDSERRPRIDRAGDYQRGRYQLHSRLRQLATDQEAWDEFDS